MDSISGAPCQPLPVDELQLDIVVTASQKGWLAPPGLTMIATSAAALDAAGRHRCPSWYFDLGRQVTAQQKGEMCMTPPLSVMYALREGLTMLREEGLAEVWRRHERVGKSARAGITGMGLDVVACARAFSSTVTAVHSPCRSPGELNALLKDLRTTHGLVLADGLGPLHGRSFRVGHLGLVRECDVRAMLAALEETLWRRRLGRARLAPYASDHSTTPAVAA